MARIASALLILLLILGGVYLYFLAPSGMEKEGDKAYQAQKYADAALKYTAALAKTGTPFSKERLLFKTGNAWNLQGERERALDFYMLILRNNPDSVYRSRIEEHLKEQQQTLARQTRRDGVSTLDLSFLNQSEAKSLVQIKTERDQIYLELLDRLIRPGTSAVDYETLELYRTFQKARSRFDSALEGASEQRVTVLRKGGPELHLVLVQFAEEFQEELQAQSGPQKVFWHGKPNLAEALEDAGRIKADGFFIQLQDSDWASAGVMLPRLVEVFQKSKIFLVFVDTMKNTEELDQFAESLETEVRWLKCVDGVPACMQSLQGLSQRKSLWQLNG